MIVSDEDLLAYVRGAPDDLPTVQALEASAVDYVAERTGRYLGPVATITTGELEARGGLLLLPDEPRGDVTLERWSGSAWEAVDASDWRRDGDRMRSVSTVARRWVAPVYRATYEAGYEPDPLSPWDSLLAPPAIKQAIRLLVAHWFENREAVVVGTITAELDAGLSMLLRTKTRTVV